MKLYPSKSLGSQLASRLMTCSCGTSRWLVTVLVLTSLLIVACDKTSPSTFPSKGPDTTQTPTTPSNNPSADTTRPSYTGHTPTIDAFDVPINTVITVKFSEPLDPQTLSPASFFLMSGSKNDSSLPRQPVNGKVSYTESGTNYIATFTPNADLAPNKSYIVLASGAITDLAGNALAQILYYSFTTAANPTEDTTAPSISATLPVNGGINISVNRNIIATFSEPMAAATFTKDSFLVQNDASKGMVSGTVSFSGNNAQFAPDAPLANDTVYNVTITTAVTDLAGNPLAAAYHWSFTTANSSDTTAPGVSVVTPRNNAVDVAINSAISATFNEPLNPDSVNATSFTLSDGTGVPVPGTVNYNGTTATFTPGTSLATGSLYTATLTTAITDLAGNALVSNYVWSFTTLATNPSDTTPPTISTESPANGAIDVARNSAVSVTFSEALNPVTVNTASFILTSAAGVVAGTVTYDGINATFIPLTDLLDSTLYTATLTASIADLAGNTLTSNYAWSFTTAAVATPSDTTAPQVVIGSSVPADGAVEVATNSAISVSFDEALSPGSVTTSTFQLMGPSGVVAGSVRYSGNTATFTPLTSLQYSSGYTATVTTGITDLAGNALASNYQWSFTTAAVPDTTRPTVVSRTPAPGSTNIPVTTSISATFSEALDPSTITSASVQLSTGGFPVAGSVLYSNSTITFIPNGNLAFRTLYTMTINATVTDLAGNPLNTNVVWNFTTVNPVVGGGGMGGGGGGG